jgi:hypothetical protein
VLPEPPVFSEKEERTPEANEKTPVAGGVT